MARESDARTAIGRVGAAVAATVGFVGARPLAGVVAATLVVSLVAVAFPGIDLAAARPFFHDGGFPAAHRAPLVDLRLAGMGLTRLVVVGLVLAGLGKLLLPKLMRAVSSRRLLFLATSLALGPGILVNAILKEWWGRPRPWQITDFGGAMDFFPAWIPGGACASNCSFPSGEASSAMWLVAFVFVVPERRRKAALAGVIAWAAAISLNRMAFGGHFLSDVLIGWGLTATVVLACRAFFLERIGPQTEARIDDGLGRLGDRLLDLAPRPTGRGRRA